MKYISCIAILLLSLTIHSQGLLLKITNPQVSGNQITYDVSVVNFDSITAMTYCMSYEQSKLSFNRIKNIISFMSIFDFSTESPNYICNKWLDASLETVSLPDNTVLYQVVFNMLQGMDGDVCFSQEPYESEFLIGEFEVLTSFFIIDDCYPDTLEVILNATQEIMPEDLGMHIRQISFSNQIQFTVDTEKSIEFNLFDIMGR
ncbi:MAG: hypothetical protein ABJC12_07130, partial [Saprospiraceae bacterium]